MCMALRVVVYEARMLIIMSTINAILHACAQVIVNQNICSRVYTHAHACTQNGLAKKVEKSRKQKKERRNRTKKIRGVKKTGACQMWLFEGLWVKGVERMSLSRKWLCTRRQKGGCTGGTLVSCHAHVLI